MEGQETVSRPQHRQRMRLAGFDYADPDHVYFITIRAAKEAMPFADPALADEIIKALLWQRQSGGLHIYSFVLMPDHLHCLLAPGVGGKSVSRALDAFKGFTTHASWRYGVKGSLWQRSFHDHVLRGEEDLKATCQYILDNPVRKGLVTDASDWPFAGMPDPLPE